MHFGRHNLGPLFVLLLTPEERSDRLRGSDRFLPHLVGKFLCSLDQPIKDANLLVTPFLDLGNGLLGLAL